MIKIIVLDRGRGRHFINRMQAKEYEETIAEEIRKFSVNRFNIDVKVV